MLIETVLYQKLRRYVGAFINYTLKRGLREDWTSLYYSLNVIEYNKYNVFGGIR